MAFVPEGQPDSSQARSDWWRCRKAPVPEGRSKSLSVPNGAKIRKIWGDLSPGAKNIPNRFILVPFLSVPEIFKNLTSANLMLGASMGEWLLSRRDRLIVARHEVPGQR